MFQTLEPKNLNKLPKSKVRRFATPKAFHASKVERLGRDGIKPFAEVRGKFPMPVFALVSNMPIETYQLTDATPPITGAFDFTTQCLPNLKDGVSCPKIR